MIMLSHGRRGETIEVREVKDPTIGAVIARGAAAPPILTERRRWRQGTEITK
jgi:hypothetical protein